MVGDGRSSSQTRPTSKWLPITRKIVSAVTFPQRRPTGSTFKVIRFSAQSKRHHPVEMVFLNISTEVLVMRKYLFAGIAIVVGLVAARLFVVNTRQVTAQSQHSS